MNLDPVDLLARQLVGYEPSADRVTSIRTRLLQAAANPAAVTRWPGRRVMTACIAALAVAACLLVAVRVGWPAREAPLYRGQILASDGAIYVRTGAPGQETVQIADGVMRFEVAHLGAGEHFHVVVGNHRVVVRGTVFHVVARHGELVSVAVARGRVDVIGPNHDVTHLAVGESWPVATPTVVLREPVPESPAVAAPTTSTRSSALPPRRPARAVTEAPVDVPDDVAPAVQPSWPGESEFRDGWSAYQRGDYGQAAQWLLASCRAATGDVAEDACFWYAVALERSARTVDAITAYRDFLERWPAKRRSDEARIQLAALLITDGHRDAARALLEDAARSLRASTRESALAALRALDRKH
jgi:hypothetical protein